MENSPQIYGSQKEKLYHNGSIFLKNNPMFILMELSKDENFIVEFTRKLLINGIDITKEIVADNSRFLPVVINRKANENGRIRIEWGYFFAQLKLYISKHYLHYDELAYDSWKRDYYGLFMGSKIIDIFAINFHYFFVNNNGKGSPILFLTESLKNNKTGIEGQQKMLYILEETVADLVGNNELNETRKGYFSIQNYEDYQQNIKSKKSLEWKKKREEK